MYRKLTIAAAAAIGALMSASAASAANVSDTFTVSATVIDDCVIESMTVAGRKGPKRRQCGGYLT